MHFNVVLVNDGCVTFGAASVVVVTTASVVVRPGVGVAVAEGAGSTAVVCGGAAVVATRAGSRGSASGKMIGGAVGAGVVISTVGGAGASIGCTALGFVGTPSAGFVVVARGLRVVVGTGFVFRVVVGTVGLVVGFGTVRIAGVVSSDVVGRTNAVVGAGTALTDGTSEASGSAAAEPTVVGASVVGKTAVVFVEGGDEVEDEVEAMGIAEAATAASVLGGATVEGAADETTAADRGGLATVVVSGESDWLTTMGFGASSEPTPEANRPPISTHTNAATASNLRLWRRALGNPSTRQESERNAEVPLSERENAASRTRSRSAEEGPVSCALATMVNGFTSILRRRSQESQSCACRAIRLRNTGVSSTSSTPLDSTSPARTEQSLRAPRANTNEITERSNRSMARPATLCS